MEPVEREAFERQLSYYKQRVDELGGENVKLDISLSELRHSLRQKQVAFSLLSELQQSIGTQREVSPVFERAVQAINRIGGMDRAAVLTPTDAEQVYRPVHAAGFHEESLAKARSTSFRVPEQLTRPDGSLLVTRATQPTVLTSDLACALDLPYFVCVPILVEETPVGLLIAGRTKEAMPLYPPLDDRDVDTFRAVAGLIAANIQNQRLVRRQEAEAAARQRFEHELEVARLIQRHYLPKRLPNPPGWQLAAYYRPAREVGGDFYDVIPLPDSRLAVVIGDVTDKGVPAALVMSATRSILRASAQRLIEPAAVLESVNEHLCPDMPARMFVTCLYGVLDLTSGMLRFANAGHDLPYVKTVEGVVELRARGMPLGLMPGSAYEEKQTVLQPGDTVLLHSDGVVEAHDPTREMFGFPRLKATIAGAPSDRALIELVLTELDAFTGASREREDDITMVTIRRAVAANAMATSGDGVVLVEFELPSRPGNEHEAIERVGRIAAELGLAQRRLERLKTAVAEATMNAMEHGSRYRADRPVSIRVLHSDNRIRVQVTDLGGALELPAVEVPDLEAKLVGEQTPRGWGRFLIEKMVDDMNVTREGSRRTVELVMELEGDSDGGT